MVDLGLRVLTRPDQSALPTIYRRLGLDYDDKVLPSIVNEVVKQVVAQVRAPVRSGVGRQRAPLFALPPSLRSSTRRRF